MRGQGPSGASGGVSIDRRGSGMTELTDVGAASASDAAAGESEPLAVRLRGIRRTYTAELAPVRALRGVDLDVAAGDFVAVMGPSGCGKSTLLNVIAGLDRVDDGTVEVAGERVDGKDENWLAKFRRH